MIPDAVLNQIQERVDIVELVSAYVPLRRAGKNFKAPCPFHQEKTPSFIVNPDKQIFHCFGCGVGGNAFSFVMKIEKKDFREVAEQLAERVGVEIPTDKPVNTAATERAAMLTKANTLAMEFYNAQLGRQGSEKAQTYLHRRGISEETIKDFKIGYAPEAWDAFTLAAKGQVADTVLERAGLLIAKKEGSGHYDRFRNRIVFPILDAKGNCVAFGARVMDDSLPKYLNSPETEIYTKGRHLYGLFQARKAVRDLDSVIVVEGYMDLIACHQAGVKNVVASLGTALTPEQVRLIKRHTKNAIILYDADKAGEMATLRGLELFLEEGMEVKIVRLPEGHDPDSFIHENGVERFRAEIESAKSLFDYKFDGLAKIHDVRSLEGKVRVANEMVTLFSKVQNEILKSAWTKELASRLKLSEAALQNEILKGRQAILTRQAMQEAQTALADPAAEELPTVEKMLMGLLFDSPSLAEEAPDAIRPENFSNARARTIVYRVLEAEESGERVTAAQLISFYKDDPETARMISMACAEMERIVDKEKTFTDCVTWMKRSRLKTEREGLQNQIQSAQRDGDMNRISQLLGEIHELNQREKQIHEKK